MGKLGARWALWLSPFQGYHARLLIVKQLLRHKSQPFGKKNFDRLSGSLFG
jgi:hypothetical protein